MDFVSVMRERSYIYIYRPIAKYYGMVYNRKRVVYNQCVAGGFIFDVLSYLMGGWLVSNPKIMFDTGDHHEACG